MKFNAKCNAMKMLAEKMNLRRCRRKWWSRHVASSPSWVFSLPWFTVMISNAETTRLGHNWQSSAPERPVFCSFAVLAGLHWPEGPQHTFQLERFPCWTSFLPLQFELDLPCCKIKTSELLFRQLLSRFFFSVNSIHFFLIFLILFICLKFCWLFCRLIQF